MKVWVAVAIERANDAIYTAAGNTREAATASLTSRLIDLQPWDDSEWLRDHFQVRTEEVEVVQEYKR